MTTRRKDTPAVESASEGPPPRRKAKGSAKARRTAARLAAVQALYQVAMTGQNADSVLREYRDWRIGQLLDDVEYVTADEDLFAHIVRQGTERRAEFDTLATGAFEGRDFSHVEPLLQAIFRAGISELITQPETPAGIIIQDYINICGAFFDTREPALVNGVLDRLAKTLRPSS